jgi:hypothetical protein
VFVDSVDDSLKNSTITVTTNMNINDINSSIVNAKVDQAKYDSIDPSCFEKKHTPT